MKRAARWGAGGVAVLYAAVVVWSFVEKARDVSGYAVLSILFVAFLTFLASLAWVVGGGIALRLRGKREDAKAFASAGSIALGIGFLVEFGACVIQV